MKAVFVAAVALAAGAAAQSASDKDQCLTYCKLYSNECCENPRGQLALCELIRKCTLFVFSPPVAGLCDLEVNQQCEDWCDSGLVSAGDGIFTCNNPDA